MRDDQRADKDPLYGKPESVTLQTMHIPPKFAVFQSAESAVSYIEHFGPEDRHFAIYIPGERIIPMYLYLDVEGERDSGMPNPGREFDARRQELITKMADETLLEMYGADEMKNYDQNWYGADASTEEKSSQHWHKLVPFANLAQIKLFSAQLMTKVRQSRELSWGRVDESGRIVEHKTYMDLSVYSKGRAMRLILNRKVGKQNTLFPLWNAESEHDAIMKSMIINVPSDARILPLITDTTTNDHLHKSRPTTAVPNKRNRSGMEHESKSWIIHSGRLERRKAQVLAWFHKRYDPAATLYGKKNEDVFSIKTRYCVGGKGKRHKSNNSYCRLSSGGDQAQLTCFGNKCSDKVALEYDHTRGAFRRMSTADLLQKTINEALKMALSTR